MDNVFYWGNLILSYGVSGYVMLKFMFEIFEPRYNKNFYIGVWGVFVLIAVFINRLNITLLKSSYGIFSVIIIGICFFKTTSKKEIIGACLFFFLYMFIIDTI